MKIIKIHGGLGNQMFQYAFAKSCSLNSGEDVFIDISSYKTGKSPMGKIDTFHNGYELESLFHIDLPVANERLVRRFGTIPDSFLHKVRRKFFPKKSHFIERGLKGVDLSLLNSGSDMYLEGYWQSEDYFSSCVDAVMDSFRFKPPVSERNLSLLNSGRNYVSIHVRRGDYLHQDGFFVCTDAYYKEAVSYMNERLSNNPCYLVFSDDIPWCKAMFSGILTDNNVKFIDWNLGNDSWQDMFLMTQCSGNIIANSTFSWWGAWLNGNNSKLVVAPKVWCNVPSYNVSRLVPDSWIRL